MDTPNTQDAIDVLNRLSSQEMPRIITATSRSAGAGQWLERFFPHIAAERVIEFLEVMAHQTKAESLHLAFQLYDHFDMIIGRALLERFDQDLITFDQLQQEYSIPLLPTPPRVEDETHFVRWLIQQCIVALGKSAFVFDLDTVTYRDLSAWEREGGQNAVEYEFYIDYLGAINTLMQIAPTVVVSMERRTDSQLVTTYVWLESVYEFCERWAHLKKSETDWLLKWSQQQIEDSRRLQMDRLEALDVLARSAFSKQID